MGFITFADDAIDVRFLETQRTRGNPFSLPIRISTEGDVSFFGEESHDLNFRPTMQLGFSRAIINYSRPVLLNRFNLYPQQTHLGWIEVKRLRLEAGLGLSAVQKITRIGLIPYKGSIQTLIYHKKTKDSQTFGFRMPEELGELEAWSPNDQGTFQTYGGISAYVGLDVGVLDIALGSIGLQNQFIVEIKKIDQNQVSLLISEESLRRRQIILGPSMADATFAQFSGKRFSSEFRLDLLNPLHHELYQDAIKGKITSLQEKLDHTRQSLKWRGRDRSFYVGVPVLGGKSFDSGDYELEEGSDKTELSFTGSRLKGVLTPMRNLQDFVYQKSNALLIVWSSEMKSTTKEAFFHRFLKIGKSLGIKGFNREVPDTKFGSVISQIAVHISQNEFESVSDMDMEMIRENFKLKCESVQLPCAHEKRLNKVFNSFSQLRHGGWSMIKRKLGLLLIREPALLYALVKTMELKKDVYFKFLSEKYQSIEGSSVIEI
jgi:hypothetical protein